jgi:D-serine deaminase-like pyridoxal phosphate-dependent protein
MTSPMPARIGDPLSRVQTPALIVDLDALDANIGAMAAHVRGRGQVLRPHAKTHKSVEVARRQLAAGAIGLCCQKVSEGEALLPSGVQDLLISNHVVGAGKAQRLCALARQVRTTTLCSDTRHARVLSDAARSAGVQLEILIEIDAGDARMGLPDGDTTGLLQIAQMVQDAPGLRLRGLQVYNGPFQHIRSHEERTSAAVLAASRAKAASQLLQDAGLTCEVISGGGTGSFPADVEAGVLTELQPGSYVFMDADYGRNLDASGAQVSAFRQSLFVQTTVIRTVSAGVVYVDAGVKSLNLDHGMPLVKGRPELAFTKASDEQGRIEASPAGPAPELGEVLMLVPSHCDPTLNQHDWIVAVRNDEVEAVWPVEGRGCLL